MSGLEGSTHVSLLYNYTCRPGTYKHSVTQGRQVEMDESFGYSRKIRNGVVMKCTKGIPEEVSP